MKELRVKRIEISVKFCSIMRLANDFSTQHFAFGLFHTHSILGIYFGKI